MKLIPLQPWIRTFAIGGGLLVALWGSTFATRAAMPPSMGKTMPMYTTLSVALSGCRGILAEILWWRIDELQRQNRTAELTILTEWLLALEPTSPEVRDFNAWNLAYNMSVTTSRPEEKWQWVKRGLTLLQEGLALNPTSTEMMHALGWIYEDKIGGPQDAAAPYYREHLSEILLPEQTPFLRDAFPALRCAYAYYTQANEPINQLRVAHTALRQAYAPDWLPRLITPLRAIWQSLNADDKIRYRHALQTLAPAYPNSSIQTFLLETKP